MGFHGAPRYPLCSPGPALQPRPGLGGRGPEPLSVAPPRGAFTPDPAWAQRSVCRADLHGSPASVTASCAPASRALLPPLIRILSWSLLHALGFLWTFHGCFCFSPIVALFLSVPTACSLSCLSPRLSPDGRLQGVAPWGVVAPRGRPRWSWTPVRGGPVLRWAPCHGLDRCRDHGRSLTRWTHGRPGPSQNQPHSGRISL